MTQEFEERRKEGSIIERHIQTIIAAVLLALVLWTGNTLIDIKTDVTTLKVTVSQLKDEIRAGSETRFSVHDWRREREIIEQRFSRIENELDWNRTKHDGARPEPAPFGVGPSNGRK
jgi:hypothetical protein